MRVLLSILIGLGLHSTAYAQNYISAQSGAGYPMHNSVEYYATSRYTVPSLYADLTMSYYHQIGSKDWLDLGANYGWMQLEDGYPFWWNQIQVDAWSDYQAEAFIRYRIISVPFGYTRQLYKSRRSTVKMRAGINMAKVISFRHVREQSVFNSLINDREYLINETTTDYARNFNLFYRLGIDYVWTPNERQYYSVGIVSQLSDLGVDDSFGNSFDGGELMIGLRQGVAWNTQTE